MNDGITPEFRKSWNNAIKALQAFGDAIRDLEQADWWKRGEGPPEYVATYEPPEWWQRGDDLPPDFGCAM